MSYSSPTQYTCLIQSANDLQDPDPTPRTLGIKVDEGPLFNIGSPLSWPAVLTASPTLVLYFPLILSHVWKFFSNSHPDHDNQHTNIFSISINKRSPLNLTIFFSHCPISLLLFTEKLKRIFYMCCPISLTLILS